MLRIVATVVIGFLPLGDRKGQLNCRSSFAKGKAGEPASPSKAASELK
jgi:hypothetical protein